MKTKTKKSSLSSEVTLGVMPGRIEYECLAEEHFYFVFCPILCRQRLQEHDDALHERVLALYNAKDSKVTHLEVHLTELVAPSYKKCRTDIQVKLRKGVRAFRLYAHRAQSSICHGYGIIPKTHQIGIPHPHCIFHAYLAHQQTVHPAKGKLHEFDALRSEMLGERRVNARNKFCHAFDAALDTRLRAGVVVRDPVEQTREAPERVCFYCGKDGRWEDRRINIFRICIW